MSDVYDALACGYCAYGVCQDPAHASIRREANALTLEREAHARTKAAMVEAQAEIAAEKARADAADRRLAAAKERIAELERAIREWPKCSGSRRAWASGEHCTHCYPMQRAIKSISTKEQP
jgi:hypothetical protein